MQYKKSSVLAMLLALSASASDLQAFPGAQIRVQQSFLDMIQRELYYELPHIVNDLIAPMIPTQISILGGLVEVLNIRVTGFGLNTARAKWAIDPAQNGIMMNWPDLAAWNIHFEPFVGLFWPIEYSFDVDINFKDATLDNGVSITADPHSGTPAVNLFNSYIDLGLTQI